MKSSLFPNRFRRRLTVAFLLVAGVASGTLAGGTFLSIRNHRLATFARRAAEEARVDLALSRPDPSPEEAGRLLSVYRRLGGVEAVMVVGDAAYSSLPTLTLGAVPFELRQRVRSGETARADVQVGGVPYLVLGGRVRGSASELYFFFSEKDLFRGLREVRDVLAVSWLVVVLLAAAAGHLIARRTLRPVRVAAGAARSLAEGLLDTRLPVNGGDEFGAWAATFNDMAQALEEKIVSLSEAGERERRFSADVAHELRTPLSAMISAASLLEEQLEELPPGSRRPVELLVSDARRLQRLVLELLELHRLEAGHESIRLEMLSLGDVLSAVVRGAGWEDQVSLDAGDVWALADRLRLERIVANLVSNALEHGGQLVRARTCRQGDVALLEVADSGPGIDPSDLPRIFDRFYKADRARSRSRGGAGLGLSIARENALALEGHLEVDSAPGRGATFTLRLPALAVTTPLPKRHGPETTTGNNSGRRTPEQPPGGRSRPCSASGSEPSTPTSSSAGSGSSARST